MDPIIPRLIAASLNILLFLYLLFTAIAIFKGAAPIPSRKSTVARMLKLAGIRKGDVLLDLGSGDGRILFAAAALGARCTGIEINPFLYWFTQLRAKLTKAPNVYAVLGDFWTADLSGVDVLTVYLVPKFMARLKAKVLAEMKPGSRVAVAIYPFPDWEPDQQVENVFLYRVNMPSGASVDPTPSKVLG